MCLLFEFQFPEMTRRCPVCLLSCCGSGGPICFVGLYSNVYWCPVSERCLSFIFTYAYSLSVHRIRVVCILHVHMFKHRLCARTALPLKSTSRTALPL